MANGYFERGEIYWVRMDNGFGGEQGVGRPGLILTENNMNTKCSTVTIAFLSKQNHSNNPFYLPVEATGITSYVILNHIMTYDKSRIGKYLGVLNGEEQKLVDDALENAFDLGYVDEASLKEKESEIDGLKLLLSEANAETAGAKAEIVKRDEEIASLRMEIEMWQKCYGRCMDMLVDVKVSGDLSRRTAASVKVVDPDEPAIAPKKSEGPKLPVVLGDLPKHPATEDNRLDINSCTATALKKIGFSLAMVRKIVQARPFKNLEDLKRVNGLKATQYKIMEPKLCCVPVVELEPEAAEELPVVESSNEESLGNKVNINKINSITALQEKTGMCQRTASEIIRHREQFGDYERVEDLLNLKNFGVIAMNRYGHMLEV